VTFDKQHEARELRKTLGKLEKDGLLDVEDAAVIVRDAGGKVHVDDETSHSTMVGAGAGGLAGIMLLWMFPVVGIALGAVGGAMVAHYLEMGIDKQFVKDVTASLKPGTSAILVVVNSSEPAAVRAALAPYKGTLFQTTLDTEAENSLREALSARS
jgi:uncharacterized membrane protein